MITQNINSFALGKDTYPDWFKTLSEAGRVLYDTSADGSILKVSISNSTGIVTAFPNDIIAQKGSDVFIIPKAAQHFM